MEDATGKQQWKDSQELENKIIFLEAKLEPNTLYVLRKCRLNKQRNILQISYKCPFFQSYLFGINTERQKINK